MTENAIHDRLTALEIWRASKDATDNLRHEQNLKNFAELKEENKNSFKDIALTIKDTNEKVTMLYEERAIGKGASAERKKIFTPVTNVALAALSGGSIFELFKWIWPGK